MDPRRSEERAGQIINDVAKAYSYTNTQTVWIIHVGGLHHFWLLSWEIKLRIVGQLKFILPNRQSGEIFHCMFHKPFFSPYWTPMLGTLCSTILELLFLQHKMCRAAMDAGWRPHGVISCTFNEPSRSRLVSWAVRVLHILKMLWKIRLECQCQFSHLDQSKTAVLWRNA